MNFKVVIFISCISVSLSDEFHHKQSDSGVKVLSVMEAPISFWKDRAQKELASILRKDLNTNKAKNVIFFIGDGMSLPTVSSTRMLLGKEENELSFEKFSHYGLSHTYCIDKQVPDSACTATAYLSGVKTNYRSINVNANVKSSHCEVNEDDLVYSIAKWAQDASKGTGIVTTTRITHASPAGVYANIPHRDWEYNKAVNDACKSAETVNVNDIAYQLVHGGIGSKLKVALGGGRRNFLNTTIIDEEGKAGYRTDGRNLIDEWLSDKSEKGKAKYISHQQQLRELDLEKTDYLLGLFESDHCMYNLDIENANLQDQEPSLTDMTVAAIKMLEKEENGYFLFVEGGRIDMAHHDNRVHKALEETKELSKAIDVARRMTNEADTLIVVSADHSHVTTYGGQADRGSNILGFGGISDQDGLPYETFSYANGPGANAAYESGSNKRVDRSTLDLKNPSRTAAATVQLSSESHAGDDVGVWASGPWSHLFTGSYEQSFLPMLMARSAQIGAFEPKEVIDADDESTSTPISPTTSSASFTDISFLCLIATLCMRKFL